MHPREEIHVPCAEKRARRRRARHGRHHPDLGTPAIRDLTFVVTDGHHFVELLAGRSAAAQLNAMALASNDGGMLPEQVWDGKAPTGTRGLKAGEGTFSATPLAWTHAQFVRLAWSVDSGTPVETPAIVACRYTGRGC